VGDRGVWKHAAASDETDFEDFTRKLATGMPLGCMGTGEEFANFRFLASDLGSYINGTAIDVDGGLSPVV
jgi:3-oxoacyl-[acyl-carrier protein] reductase